MTLGERDAEKSDSQVLHGLIINNIITVNNTACHNNLTMTLREWIPSQNVLTYTEGHDPQNQCCHQTQPEGHGFSGIFLVLDSDHLC